MALWEVHPEEGQKWSCSEGGGAVIQIGTSWDITGQCKETRWDPGRVGREQGALE